VIDTIVIGEYERAFTGAQFATLQTWCTRHGIQPWPSETGDSIDLGNCWPPSHSAKSSAPATESWLRYTNRPPGKAVTSAADHLRLPSRRRWTVCPRTILQANHNAFAG
jgi:hypothetical protein